YGFLHLTLQEYFTAQYATEQHQLDALLQHVGDPWWEEVILLYAGRTRDASPLLEYLMDEIQDDIFCTNLVLAGRCLAARPTIRNTALREEVTSRLFDKLLNTQYSLI